MIKEKRITNIPYVLAITIVFLIIVPLGILFTFYEYKRTLKEMDYNEQELFGNIESRVRLELNNNFSLLEFYQKKAEQALMDRLEQETLTMYKIIENVLWEDKNLGLSLDHKKKILKNIFKTVPFGQAPGYYFAFSIDGTAQHMPANPELETTNLLDTKNLEGKNIFREMIQLAEQKGSGFYKYRSLAPDNKKNYPSKIAYIKKIPDLDYIIGAVGYIGDIKNKARATYLEIFKHTKFHSSDFRFIINENDQINTHFSDTLKTNHSSETIERLFQLTYLSDGNCFQTDENFIKDPAGVLLICTRHLKAWDWILGFGSDTSHIRQAMEKRKDHLRHRLKKDLLFFLFIMAVIAIVVMFMGRHFTNKIEQGFSVFAEFFQNASQTHKHIDLEKLQINEFKSLANFANKMVDSRMRQDTIILDHTKKLENLNNKLAGLASRDGLTGVYNRRYFDQFLEKELSRAKRNKKPISLFMMDIDYFKNYNDTYGHQKGDECLKKIAAAIDSICKRPADVFARFGGEEFTAIMPDTDKTGARAIANIMMEKIVALKIRHKASNINDHVTFSMGIYCLIPKQSTTCEELIEQADQALYKAKNQGRNSFVIQTG